MREKTVAALAITTMVLVGCGDKPVPEHGTVTDARFSPAWMQWMPGVTSCSGNPPVCTTSAGYPIFWPDSWRVEVTDDSNREWKGSVEVSSAVFDRCRVGSTWPDCSEAGA